MRGASDSAEGLGRGREPAPSPAELASTEAAGPAGLEESSWVRRAARGDRAAFARIYERFARTVHGVLLAWTGPQEAEDLVQEVFTIALARIDTLERPAELASWLCTIARNRARDHYRSRSRRTELEAEEELVDERGSPSKVEDEEEARAALAAIRALPEAYRETLVLRLVEGLSGPEIAARTGMTHGSVRVNLHRGMRLLRESLAEGGR